MRFELSERAAANMLAEHYGVTALNLRRFDAELATVYRVETNNQTLALKAMSVPEHRREVIEWHSALMERARAHGLPVPAPHPGSESIIVEAATEDGDAYLHLTEWLPGRPLGDWPRAASVLQSVGHTAALISVALEHADAPPPHVTHRWRLESTLAILDECASAVGDPAQLVLVEKARRNFAEIVEPLIPQLPQAVVHHDLHDANLLFAASTDNSAPTLSGVLDFGDAVLGLRVAELAVAAGYASRGTHNPAAAFLQVVRGWSTVTSLSDDEVTVLLPAAIGRLAVNLTLWKSLSKNRTDTYALARSELSASALGNLLDAHDRGLTDDIRQLVSNNGSPCQ